MLTSQYADLTGWHIVSALTYHSTWSVSNVITQQPMIVYFEFEGYLLVIARIDGNGSKQEIVTRSRNQMYKYGSTKFKIDMLKLPCSQNAYQNSQASRATSSSESLFACRINSVTFFKCGCNFAIQVRLRTTFEHKQLSYLALYSVRTANEI